MTGSKSDKDQGKPAAKDEDAKTAKTAPKDGERDDAPEGQQVMERDDIGAADDPDGPETVDVITQVRPGLAN